MGFFDSLKKEEDEEVSSRPAKRPYIPPKPKKDNSKLIMDFSQVVNCIHVNIHPAQRETLEKIVGSFKVADVRKFLTDKLLEALKP